MTRSQATPESSQIITLTRMLEEREETMYAQAAVIEKLREALSDTLWFLERYSNRWDSINGKHPNCVVETAREALAIPTDSTQDLAAPANRADFVGLVRKQNGSDRYMPPSPE